MRFGCGRIPTNFLSTTTFSADVVFRQVGRACQARRMLGGFGETALPYDLACPPEVPACKWGRLLTLAG